MSRGKATVDYNRNQVLETLYNCITESRAGIDKDTVHLELQNNFMPIGADYIHKYEYGASTDDDTTVCNFVIFDVKIYTLFLHFTYFISRIINIFAYII